MAVNKYVQVSVTGTYTVHPNHYICDTTGELPASGLKLGDTALALDTNVQYKAASATTWTSNTGSAVNAQLITKTIDESVTSSTTLQNDNELLFAMTANSVWRVTGSYTADNNGGAGPAVKFGLSVPAACTVAWGRGADFELQTTLLTASSTFNSDPSSAAANLREIRFYYRVINAGTAGNFQLTWAQAVSTAVSTFVRKYSTLVAVQVA